VRGIERRCLERLFEAVHIDQDVWSAAGLRKKIADLSDTGSTASRRQSQARLLRERNGCRRRHQLACATVIVEARSGPNQGFARPPFTGLRVVRRVMSVPL